MMVLDQVLAPKPSGCAADDVARVSLTVQRGSGWRGVGTADFEFRLRVPAWAGLRPGDLAPRVNGAVTPCAAAAEAGGGSAAGSAWYCSVCRRWRAGEK